MSRLCLTQSMSRFSSCTSGFGDGCDLPVQPGRARSEVPRPPTPQGGQGDGDPQGSAENCRLPAPGCFPGGAGLWECQLLN